MSAWPAPKASANSGRSAHRCMYGKCWGALKVRVFEEDRDVIQVGPDGDVGYAEGRARQPPGAALAEDLFQPVDSAVRLVELGAAHAFAEAQRVELTVGPHHPGQVGAQLLRCARGAVGLRQVEQDGAGLEHLHAAVVCEERNLAKGVVARTRRHHLVLNVVLKQVPGDERAAGLLAAMQSQAH
eukprot:CAMPEP_0171839876 /NCGR_PEP_ID=MMETSP0992-20121227/13623_1 /TAXON_ID=483369 /ORGANISM="non described non described, Strain CCMP2098" /LENGTH=183 /DNA_ID=CAMNT_0012456541 /DNA_START=348 /DNA_END=901 /DNA_ORIENTATION=+